MQDLVNTHLKALAEIYMIHSFAPLWNPKKTSRGRPDTCSSRGRSTCRTASGAGSRGSPTPSRRRARPPRPLFLLFENSKAIADFDTKAVSKIDQTWRILARRRSVKSISWNDGGKSSDRIPPLRFNPGFVTAVAPSALRFNPGSRMFSQWSARSLEVAKQRTSALG